MFEDKTLVCKECGNEFVFTAGEQEFYAEHGFQNEPQRCKSCRDARKNAARGPRQFFTAPPAPTAAGKPASPLSRRATAPSIAATVLLRCAANKRREVPNENAERECCDSTPF